MDGWRNCRKEERTAKRIEAGMHEGWMEGSKRNKVNVNDEMDGRKEERDAKQIGAGMPEG